MVHCLLDDTIKFVTLAKKHKHKLTDMKLNGNYMLKEEDFTLFASNGDTIIFTENMCKIYNKSGNLVKSLNYDNIDDVLDYIDKYLSDL